jgi:hypothetical protein
MSRDDRFFDDRASSIRNQRNEEIELRSNSHTTVRLGALPPI